MTPNRKHHGRRNKGPKSIVEIGMDISHGKLESVKRFLDNQNIPFFECPPVDPPYRSLEELRADCILSAEGN